MGRSPLIILSLGSLPMSSVATSPQIWHSRTRAEEASYPSAHGSVSTEDLSDGQAWTGVGHGEHSQNRPTLILLVSLRPITFSSLTLLCGTERLTP